MDQDDVASYSCVNVYNIAADIGKDFERIIDKFGPDVLTTLMPKVINALEHLEKLTQRYEDLELQQESSQVVVEELKTNIRILESQRHGIDETRRKYAQDVEDIEADLQEERRQLCDRVNFLLSENRKLSNSVSNNGGGEEGRDEHSETIERLQSSVSSLRSSLHATRERLGAAESDGRSLAATAERLQQANADLRRRNRQAQATLRSVVQERASLHAALLELQRDHTQLQVAALQLQRHNTDLSEAQSTPPADPPNPADPTRPRFSLTELKDILYQRNELKAKVSDLQDQLNFFKEAKDALKNSPQTPEDGDSSSSKAHNSHIICPPEEAYQSEPLVDLDRLHEDIPRSTSPPTSPPPEDAPVQGPMPQEPSDAPWRRGETGVRKFLSRIRSYTSTVLSDTPVLGTLDENGPILEARAPVRAQPTSKSSPIRALFRGLRGYNSGALPATPVAVVAPVTAVVAPVTAVGAVVTPVTAVGLQRQDMSLSVGTEEKASLMQIHSSGRSPKTNVRPTGNARLQRENNLPRAATEEASRIQRSRAVTPNLASGSQHTSLASCGGDSGISSLSPEVSPNAVVSLEVSPPPPRQLSPLDAD